MKQLHIFFLLPFISPSPLPSPIKGEGIVYESHPIKREGIVYESHPIKREGIVYESPPVEGGEC